MLKYLFPNLKWLVHESVTTHNPFTFKFDINLATVMLMFIFI